MPQIQTISRSFPRLLPIVILPCLFAIAGCAQLNPTHTGYLTDYSQLQTKNAKVPIIRPYVVEAGIPAPIALADIDSFTIEPVAWLAGDSTPSLVLDDCRKNLSAKLRKALADELGALRPIVETPGPRTAKIRAAVTQVAYARPIINSALTVVAVPVFNGGGVVEAEVIAPDGRQIAVVVAALPGRARDVLGFFTWQGHAESAMSRSAAELRTALSPPPSDLAPPDPLIAPPDQIRLP
jgi:hypothetical protein